MKVVIASGGTGGHILPALNLAEYLRAEYSAEVCVVGKLRKYAEVVRTRGFAEFPLDVDGLQTRSLFQMCGWAWKMGAAFIRSVGILSRLRPQAVVGFGGYSSFPVILAAWVLRIPSVIHEQNVVPGKANRWLAGFARKVAISFSESQAYFSSRKTVFTGYPLRDLQPRIVKEDFFRKHHLDPKRMTILVCGGSQGSRALNTAFIEAAQRLGQKLSFQVIHLAGEADAEIVKAVYQKIDVPHAVFSYYDQMGDLYGCADLVIARAGAGTVQELLLLNVPVVLVPYPYAGDHQKANASVLTKMGRAVMIEEKHLTADHLKVQVLELADIAKKEGPSEVDWAEAARASQQRLAETVLGVI